MSQHTIRATPGLRAAFGLSAAGALAFTLVACGGQDGAQPDTTPATVTSTAAAIATAGATTTAGTPTTTGIADAARNAAALAAIATAQEATGGTAYEIDDEDDDRSWEVDVLVGERSVEVKVSGDGSTVRGRSDDDDADDDKARLARARTTLAEGIQAALARVPGALDDVELDEKDGTDVWEVSIDTANDDVEVYVATDDARIVAVDR